MKRHDEKIMKGEETQEPITPIPRWLRTWMLAIEQVCLVGQQAVEVMRAKQAYFSIHLWLGQVESMGEP